MINIQSLHAFQHCTALLRVSSIKRLVVSVRVAIPAWAGNWLFSETVQTGSEAHPASFPGIERPGREVHHSYPSNAKVKHEWSYSSVPRYAFMAWMRTALTL